MTPLILGPLLDLAEGFRQQGNAEGLLACVYAAVAAANALNETCAALQAERDELKDQVKRALIALTEIQLL